ncbi:Putative esterase protein [Salinisphaera shabanensis E1L3A]|uniref:Esterase protein n=1 Tax=Salinisphaera shabanensis E1L3A TaxID=1033802 RepID=U2G2R8_9GAMM|nr:PaaI family thioesterase [Salinisphaera shabanensis]ERJ20473.1 Putative esterase protein [Salinisphaera shabanensis E1L3A]
MDQRLEQVIAHPLHQHLGIETIESESGKARLSIVVGDNVINPAGVFHGGVLYLLCDVCAYAGLLSQLGAHTEAVTHDIHVSVMRGARAGEVVVFESNPVRVGRRIAFIDVSARVDERLIASARVTKTLLDA